ncbi:MAG: MarR family winged helix-turn-helix transcriptional regulator [Marinomonas sp.]|uniref:MarR family winged helix-turn-helix transcriptional regulator n=1 Tax=unclassified Marinomonas TaxID=196814 RepID=UPI0007AF6C68|nr:MULTISPECIES: winged helix DNA-binding protein [unclassified Marinomonas]KZM39273.1 hypothetical protein OA92_20480 [Marinomonas sp. SBI22]KZM40180.1 hypothetical protein OA91_20380 [Marinomonas sp. SBI8L]
MKKKQTIHQAVFPLSIDLQMKMNPKLDGLSVRPTLMQLRAMRQIRMTGQSTLLDISNTLKRDKSQIKRLVDELDELGLVRREPNPKDKRSKLLFLTQKGIEFFEYVERVEMTFSEQLMEGISDEELEVFFNVSNRLLTNLRESSDD